MNPRGGANHTVEAWEFRDCARFASAVMTNPDLRRVDLLPLNKKNARNRQERRGTGMCA